MTIEERSQPLLPDCTVYSDEIIAGDCNGDYPLIVIKNEVPLHPDEDGYPQDYDEFLQYGAKLPPTVVRERAIEVGCSEYRTLANIGLVPVCKMCPINNHQD